MGHWESAILKAYHFKGGVASNQDIYEVVGQFITLTPKHLRRTKYGGRPAYQHQVRSHITNLHQKGDLSKVSRGVYRLTAQGKARIT